MAVVFEQGESFADLQKKNTIQNEDEDVGFFESALAGVATGLWNIPKGFVSLGAELFDLVVTLIQLEMLKNGSMKLTHLTMKLKLELLEKLHKQ